MQLLEEEREAHRRERQELLNRIAAPDRPIVDGATVPHEPEPMSQTDQELSYIGGEVPDGVSVGSLREIADGNGSR